MAAEKAQAIVLRTTDWSETSRIATLWTREFGKVRVLAKGGRRLKSPFESALDLLTLCSIVLLRKSSGGLDLLTEARVVQRFSKLSLSLPALYGAYYVAELLGDWTEENDPHPGLFDRAVEALRGLNDGTGRPSLWALRFETGWLGELGHMPLLRECAGCGAAVGGPAAGGRVAFSVAAGGCLCPRCGPGQSDRQTLSAGAWQAMQALGRQEDWAGSVPEGADAELRRVLGQYVTYLLGRRPRLLSYLEGFGGPNRGS